MLGVKTVEFFSQRIITRCVMSAANQWLNTVNSPLFQSIPKLPICNLYISHNTPCLPPKTFHNLCLQWPQGKKRQCLCKIMGGKQGVSWGICKWQIAASVQIPNIPLLLKYLKSQRAVLWTFVHLNKIVHSRKLTFTEMLTSGDLKSGDSLFCTAKLWGANKVYYEGYANDKLLPLCKSQLSLVPVNSKTAHLQFVYLP